MSADQLRQAYELIRQGQKAEAVVLLQPILRADRNNADAWWLMANALTDPPRQVQALNEVLRLRPNDARAEKMLGRVQNELQRKEDDFSFPVSDDDPFSSASQSSSFSSSSRGSSFSAGSSSNDPFSTSGSDPFAQSPGDKPKRGETFAAPPVQRQGRNPFVTCLAIIGVLTLGCCVLTVFVVPRVAGPIIEQVATQFPEMIGSVTGMPELQNAFATLAASGGEFTVSQTFNQNEANDRGVITVGQSITGNVDTFEDDFYTLTTSGNETITINVESQSELDPQLYVYDSRSQLIGENDDISMTDSNLNSRLTVTLPSAGKYYLVVSAFGTGGSYEIRVSG